MSKKYFITGYSFIKFDQAATAGSRGHQPDVRKWPQVEMQAMDYFTVNASYDSFVRGMIWRNPGLSVRK